jgi:hypothetical protein
MTVAWSELASAATSLAQLWRDKRRCTEARDLLAPVYGWFTEGLDTPVLQDAKKLLDGDEPALASARARVAWWADTRIELGSHRSSVAGPL